MSGGGILPSPVIATANNVKQEAREGLGVRWVKEKRANGAYLYPKDAMQKIYKAYFIKRLRKLMEQQKLKIEDTQALEKAISQLATVRWNVHANAPFWRAGTNTGIPGPVHSQNCDHSAQNNGDNSNGNNFYL